MASNYKYNNAAKTATMTTSIINDKSKNAAIGAVAGASYCSKSVVNSSSNGQIIQLKQLYSNGPKVEGHIACVINNDMYVHGGLQNKNDKIPTNKLYKFDLTNGWHDITPDYSPALSHHCAVTYDNFIILIGGWNGSNRISDVFVYNIVDGKFSQAVTKGFPSGAGLSSHTCTLLKDGRIVIFGREGSIRTQRRYGNCFILNGNPNSLKFSYESFELGCSSRSGHSAIAMDKGHIMLIGGRKDKVIELHSYPVLQDNQDLTNNQVLVSIQSNIASGNCKPLKKEPSGRRFASCIKLNDSLCMIHGGETFDSSNREPIDNTLILDTNSFKWYSIGESGVHLQNHTIINLNGRFIVHGGITVNNQVNSVTYEINTI